MKRVLKAGAVAGVGLVSVIGAGALYIHLGGLPRYPVDPIALQVQATPQQIARGKKLASFICVGCHLDSRTGRLTGRRLADVPPRFGVVYSTNITRHPERGLGGWSDGQIAHLLRTGVARDGRYVPPWMVKLPHLADQDLQAIIAFLRSDDPLVASTDTGDAPMSQPSFLSKLLCRLVFKKLPYPTRPIAAPLVSDKVAHGRYLVTGLDCYGCHSASWETMNISAPERSAGYLGGGNALIDFTGQPIRSANITPDDETGIGRWSQADLARALREGFRPDRTPIRAPMAPMPQLTDDEVGAIYAYLRTVPRLRNPVPRSSALVRLAAGAPEGKRLYYRYACVSCHGQTGAQGEGDLTQAAKRFPTRDGLAAWIKDAPVIKPGTRMPAWRGIIAEHEYDPLISYVLELGRPPER